MRNIIQIVAIIIVFTGNIFAQTNLICDYTYDDLNRLTVVTYADGTQIVYEYDQLGNRISLTTALDCPVTTNVQVGNVMESSATVTFDNSGFPATVGSFDVELSTDNTNFNTVATGITTTSFDLTGLSANQTYYVRIVANCNTGTLTTSSVRAFNTNNVNNQPPTPVGDCDPNDDDTEAPQFINCPTTVLTYGTDPDACGAFVSFSIPVPVDNCPGVVVNHTSGPQPGDFVDVGSFPVVYTAVDTAGNTATCSFTVEVNDTQLPSVICPQDITLANDFGQCARQVFGIAPSLAQDNCDFEVTWAAPGASLSSGTNNASGTSFPVGTTTVTYTIAETNNPDGNRTETCSFNVTIEDEELPTINICPADIVQSNDLGECGAIVTYTTPTFNDNCDGNGLTGNLVEGLFSGSFFPVGTTVVAYEYTDAAGNGPTRCEFTVTVEDDENPILFCEEILPCNTYTFDAGIDLRPLDATVVTVEVPNSFVLTDVNVQQLLGDYPSLEDLNVTLTSPAGTVVTLFDGSCTGAAAFDFGSDDASAATFTGGPCAPFDNGFSYQPVGGALADFNGENAQGTWTFTFTSTFGGACGRLEGATLELCGSTITLPTVAVSVNADAGGCDFTQATTVFDPRFTDNCPDAFITHDYIFGPFDNTLQGSVFPVGTTNVNWTATDQAGNTTTCLLVIEVLDTQAPEFLNCPAPDIIQEAEPGICGAFVSFSSPLAEDNCGSVTVTQTDATGLGTGGIFPVGTTVLEFSATDPAGNVTQCSLRVIVNDTQAPVLVCPQSVVQTTDPWLCEAVVNDIAPASFADNCPDNISIAYQINFPAGTDTVIASGFFDASGETFPKGTSTVTYRLADAPTILLTEITQDIGILNGGMDPVPYTVITTNDYAEITNFGPATLNATGLQLERTGGAPDEIFTVPDNTLIGVGETLVVHFGNGTDDPANLFFNVPCALDLSTAAPAAYVLSFKGRVLDVVAVNGFDPVGAGTLAVVTPADWQGLIPSMSGKGGVYRPFAFDNNTATDFRVADVCAPITIGALNPGLNVAADNGTITSFRSEADNVQTCAFDVTVNDEELPYCGEFVEYLYAGGSNLNVPNSITGGTVLQSVINVPDSYLLGDVDVLDLLGTHSNTGDLTFKLTSPEGTQVVLFDGLCAGTADFDLNLDSDSIPSVDLAPCAPLGGGEWFAPLNSLCAVNSAFYGENAQGDWTLEIADTTAADDGQLQSWALRLHEIQNYSQQDTVLNNDPDLCSAEFTWFHPRLIDNCKMGSVTVKYVANPILPVPTGGLVVGGSEVTEVFTVGETIVRYILEDAVGNVDSCEFLVTVLDVQDPVVVCPADIIINLAGGECRETVFFDPVSATDNCAVVDTISFPPSGSEFEIGITEVFIAVLDSAGNSDTCRFNVIVNEFVPVNGTLTCNGDINFSLDGDCMEEITPDMILEGGNYGCYEDYIVTVSDQFGPIATSPVVTDANIGQTLIVTITDPDTGNTCWSEIIIEDKAVPELLCPRDTTILCTSPIDTMSLGSPIVISCETSTATSFSDAYTTFGSCANPNAQIIRSFDVTDESGNTSNCVQVITIVPVTFADLTFPASFDGFANPVYDCADVAANPALTTPAVTGTPLIDGQPIAITGTCNLSVTFNDDVFPTCESGFDIIRNWGVYNPCDPLVVGVNPRYFQQLIRVEDNTAPVITCPGDLVISTDPTLCGATVIIPAIDIFDDCSTVSVQVETPVGSLFTNGGTIQDTLALGTYPITYTATDGCGNQSVCVVNLTVADLVAPTMVCDEITDVNLSSDGRAVVLAEVFDDGSTDACGIDFFEVRRMTDACGIAANLNFGPSVEFCCADAETTVMVQLRAYDFAGNFNDCMVEVEVQDKLPPVVLACPVTVSINCDEYIALGTSGVIATYFADAQFSDNCGFTTDTLITTNIDNCNEGTITRRITASDSNGSAVCTQTIQVRHVSDFVVEFPADVTATCTQNLPDTGAPLIFFDDCELVGVSFEDQRFDVVVDACYKIVRQWTVINWCVVGDEVDQEVVEVSELALRNAGILPFNGFANDGNDVNERTFRDSWTLTAQPDESLAGTDAAPDTDPDANPWDGYITYQQTIKVNDPVAPEVTQTDLDICIDGPGCTTDVELPIPATDDCSDELDIAVSGDLGNFFREDVDPDDVSVNGFVVNDVAPGTYAVRYTVTDNCGNTTIRDIEVVVRDCKKPTPYCIDGFIVGVMPSSGEITVWASDFDLGSTDNCPGAVTASFDPAGQDTSLVLTCAEVAIGNVPVRIYFTDAAGNVDFCDNFVRVQDVNDACGGNQTARIAGTLETETGIGVDAVSVSMNGGGTLMTNSATDGTYEMDVPTLNDYTITPLRDDNPLNGVTTFDLVLISKYILGESTLTTPYQLIAADANNSQSISTLDIVQLRKLILYLDDHLANNTSWRFVDAAYVFPDPTAPWGFPEVVSLNNLATDQLTTDFVAVKIGDVNSSVQANVQQQVVEPRSNDTYRLSVADRTVKAGETVTVDFTTEELVAGYQFTLSFGDAFAFRSIVAGTADERHFGTRFVEEGLLTMSWNGTPVTGKQFGLTFTALSDVRLSEVFVLNDRYTVSEAYLNNERLEMVLDFGQTTSANTFALHQNKPNPFSGETSIGFTLPEATTAILTITDAGGRVLQRLEAAYEAGYQEIRIDQLPNTLGVLYYRLDTPTDSAVRKMVRLK